MAGVSLFALYLSFSACLLHWRVENEPGAAPSPGLFTAHLILLATGGTGTAVFPSIIMAKKSKPYRHLLAAGAIATILYAPLLALTLILLV